MDVKQKKHRLAQLMKKNVNMRWANRYFRSTIKTCLLILVQRRRKILSLFYFQKYFKHGTKKTCSAKNNISSCFCTRISAHPYFTHWHHERPGGGWVLPGGDTGQADDQLWLVLYALGGIFPAFYGDHCPIKVG